MNNTYNRILNLVTETEDATSKKLTPAQQKKATAKEIRDLTNQSRQQLALKRPGVALNLQNKIEKLQKGNR